MDERMVAALDQFEARAQKLYRSLQKASECGVISPSDLSEALHDAANIAASIRGLRRVARVVAPAEPA